MSVSLKLLQRKLAEEQRVLEEQKRKQEEERKRLEEERKKNLSEQKWLEEEERLRREQEEEYRRLQEEELRKRQEVIKPFFSIYYYKAVPQSALIMIWPYERQKVTIFTFFHTWNSQKKTM